MVAQDDKDKMDEDVNKIEYAMSFYDGESVRKVQQQRELQKHKPTDEQFSGQLERMFGRGLTEKEKKEKREREQNLDQIKVVR